MNIRFSDRNFIGLVRPTILVADDDEGICDLLSRYLTIENFDVASCNKGSDIWNLIETARPHLVILDLHLPDTDGFDLASHLYENYNIPFIMLTARDTIDDRVQGLSIGADDYITKPFDLNELSARIRAVLRRSRLSYDWSSLKKFEPVSLEPPANPYQKVTFEQSSFPTLDCCFDKPGVTIWFDEWQLMAGSHSLMSPQGAVIKLSDAEHAFLVCLLRTPNKLLTRDEIMWNFRGRPLGPYERTIDVFIAKLRRKIEADPNSPAILKTVYGEGYIFTAKVRGSTNSQ